MVQNNSSLAANEARIQKITTHLWFDNNAEEAANFYVSIFKNSRIVSVSHYGKTGPRPEGTVMPVAFQLDGQELLAFNGGPVFTFSPAISLVVNCETQQEVDEMWEKLSTGGAKIECGWVTDKYGLSWQIVPTIVEKLLLDKNPEKSNRVMEAILKMKKLDIETLQEAYEGK